MLRSSRSLDARSQYDASQPEPVYGEAMLGYSALAIVRYLETLNGPEYKEWITKKPKLFVDRHATYEEAQEIVAMGRKYVR